ncbi:MAG: hypothetical protein ACR2P1_13545 [Pseudomonadales bacterium]
MLIHRLARALPLVLLMMAGCASQIRTASDLSAHVEQQVSEHRYAAALLSISKFSKPEADTEQLSKLRDRVNAAAARYESDTINTARKLVAQGNWHAAQLVYHDARRRYPEGLALNKAEEDFEAQRDAFIAHLRVIQYAEKAKYLNAEIAQLEQITAAAPFNLDAKRELARQKDQQQLIATALLDAGERQLSAKNYAQARRYLTLSNNLIASTATQKALRQLPRPVKKLPKKAKARINPAPVKVLEPALVIRPDTNVDTDAEFKQTVASYRTARKQGDLLRAQRQLGQALTLRPQNNSLLEEQKTLAEVVRKHVQEKLENGKYLYSMGEVDAAIAAWQIAAALAPQDQALQQRLERAQKFRQRYEELKK